MFVPGPIKIYYHNGQDYTVAENAYASHSGDNWNVRVRCRSTTNPFLALLAWAVVMDPFGNVIHKSYPLKVEVGKYLEIAGSTPWTHEVRLYVASCTPDGNASPPISCGWPSVLAWS